MLNRLPIPRLQRKTRPKNTITGTAAILLAATAISGVGTLSGVVTGSGALTMGAMEASGTGIVADQSTFTVSHWPSSPYVGEAVRVWIEGGGGHTIANPLMASASNLGDIWVESDVGDMGAVFQSVTGKDAEYVPGRYNTHVYESGGTKTWQISSWVFGGDTLTQDYSITDLVDPDDETWGHIYWVDLSTSPSTTGFDAEDATNTHITSHAAWVALDEAHGTGTKIRVRFRGGVDHRFTGSATWRQGCDVVYMDTHDGTECGFVDAIGSYTGWTIFQPTQSITNAPRWIFRNINVQGKYDPTTGGFDNGADIELFATGDVEDTAASFYRCVGHGMDILCKGSGVESLDRDYRFAMVDCEVTDWNNFGLTFSGGSYEVMHRGCSVKQNMLSILGDGARPGTDPDEADHNPTRIARFYRAAITQCELYSHSGWSALGGHFGIQQVIRLYMSFNPAGSKANVLMNDMCGRVGIEWGTASSSETIGNAAECLFACNNINLDRQGGMVEMTHCGGLISYSNVTYVPNLNHAITSNVYVLRRQRDWATVSAAIWDSDGYCGFNTYFSDNDSSTNKNTDAIDESVLDNHSSHGVPTGIVVENNLISADGHTGTYVAASAFSRGDNFRPITGSAADDTVTAGPPVDFEGNKRSNPTNKGAHHAAGSSVSASAPANSVVPTIALSAAETDIITCIAEGTWTNNDPPLLDWTWQYDSGGGFVDYPASDLKHATKFDSSGLSGDVRLVLGFVSREGSRVTATSNTLPV